MEFIRNGLFGKIPSSMITAETDGLYGTEILNEIKKIIGYYNIYEMGADFNPEGAKDYTPAELNYKHVKKLINKEAAFMFAKPLDFSVQTNNEDDDEAVKKQISIMQSFLNNVLKSNQFNGKVLKAARDCFIGKRIAIVANFSEETGISISFSPSLEFVYETDIADTDLITKLVLFYVRKDATAKQDQEIYKKKYWLENGICHISEIVYDGTGKEKEIIIEDMKTLFTYIPGVVIVNEGLTGDIDGESDVENIAGYESWYSRLGSADIDTMRKGMNPVRYTVDMTNESTLNLPINPGAYWDLQTSEDKDNTSASVGVLETNLGYSEPLDTTLRRLKNSMYEQLSIPDVSSEKLQGVITSGKSLKGIYWELIIRCEEKLTAWKPALEFVAETIIEGAKLYPKAARFHTIETLSKDIDYIIEVENNYPIPEDEQEEKQTDLAEVTAQTMSKKSYMKKWRRLTDKEAQAELKQIAEERELLENSFAPVVEDEEPKNEEEELDKEGKPINKENK